MASLQCQNHNIICNNPFFEPQEQTGVIFNVNNVNKLSDIIYLSDAVKIFKSKDEIIFIKI